jgi:hypothetical protein
VIGKLATASQHLNFSSNESEVCWPHAIS